MRNPPSTHLLAVSRTPKPPAHLSPESRKLWRTVVREWELGEDGFPILLQALEALDEVRRAQDVLKKDGITAIGRNNEVIAHPVCRLLKNSRDQFLRAWRQLDLAAPGELPPRIGRPGKSNPRY
jgi:P27 family predicted phage terminase small subunit